MSLPVIDEALQPVDWETVDDACYTWLNDALGMNDRVIWENQNVPQPSYPYVSILRNSETDAGRNEVSYRDLDVNGNIIGVDPGAGVAYEREAVIIQPITWTLSIKYHIDPDNGAYEPGKNAMAQLSKAKRSLGKKSVLAALYAGGVSFYSVLSGPSDISVVVNGQWLSQASLDVLLGTVSVMTERVGFIEQVELKSTQFGIDELVDAG